MHYLFYTRKLFEKFDLQKDKEGNLSRKINIQSMFILLPLVLITVMAGNSTFFGLSAQVCFSVSASLLASFLVSHMLFFVLLYLSKHFLMPLVIVMNLSPLYINTVNFFVYTPWITFIAIHWLPIFLSLLITPIFGKLFVYFMTACHFQERIHFGTQKLLYILGGILIVIFITQITTLQFHPEIYDVFF